MSSKPKAAAGEAAPAAPKKGLGGKIKIIGAIVGVVALEWAVAFMYLPGTPTASAEHGHELSVPEGENASGDAEHASGDSEHGKEEGAEAKEGHDKKEEGHAKKEEGHGKKEEGHGKKEEGHGKKEGGEKSAKNLKPNDLEEVKIGEFSIPSYSPVSGTTSIVSFQLFGTVLHRNSEEFERRFGDSENRVRDRITTIIRSAEIPDLTDAGLGLIKRRILETTNKTLGKPLMQEVLFSEFSYFEQ